VPILFSKHGLIVASATSAGLTALAVKLSQKRKAGTRKSLPTQVKVARQAKTAESAWQESQVIPQKVSADVHLPGAYEVQ